MAPGSTHRPANGTGRLAERICCSSRNFSKPPSSGVCRYSLPSGAEAVATSSVLSRRMKRFKVDEMGLRRLDWLLCQSFRNTSSDRSLLSPRSLSGDLEKWTRGDPITHQRAGFGDDDCSNGVRFQAIVSYGLLFARANSHKAGSEGNSKPVKPVLN